MRTQWGWLAKMIVLNSYHFLQYVSSSPSTLIISTKLSEMHSYLCILMFFYFLNNKLSHNNFTQYHSIHVVWSHNILTRYNGIMRVHSCWSHNGFHKEDIQKSKSLPKYLIWITEMESVEIAKSSTTRPSSSTTLV